MSYIFRGAVQSQVSQMLFYLQDLLELSPSSTTKLLTAEDQLFLFETIGLLIISGNHSNEVPTQNRIYYIIYIQLCVYRYLFKCSLILGQTKFYATAFG